MPPLTAGCREDWAEEGLERISLVTVESPPPLVTLLRAALPAEGLCCDLAAEEPPLLIGCATLVPVELEPPLTCVEPEGRLAAGREAVADERVVLPDERVVLPVEREVVAEERPVAVRFWVAEPV